MPDEPVKGPTVVCSAFIEKEKKFMLLFCPRFKVWRLPGGRVEFDEILEGTLKREMKEELGIAISEPKFLGYGQDHQFQVRDQKETSRLLIFFHVKTDKEPTVDPNEAEEYKWATIEEIKKEQNKEGALTDFFNRNPDIKF